MQTSKVVTMLAGVAALSGVAYAGEVMGAPAPTPAAGAEFIAKGKDTIQVRFEGRTEFQYSTEGTDDGFEFRRLRLGAKAKIGCGFYTDTVLEMADVANNGGADLELDKAIIGYKVNDMFKVTAGYSKVVFGYEETSSSSKGVYLERSNLNDALDGTVGYDRRRNVTLHADFGYGFSAAYSFANDGDTSNGGEDAGHYARIQWTNDTFLVGADFADVGDNDAFTVYAQYSQGGLTALLEFFDAEVDGADVDGYAARVSYKWNKWEPVVRYSDWENGGVDQEELLVGVNYYIAPQVTLLTAYIDESNGNADSDSFTTRLRVLW